MDMVDWFRTGTGAAAQDATMAMNKQLAEMTPEAMEKLDRSILRATEEAIDVQRECGIHVVTDGEMARENYIHHLCRHIEGIDFEHLTKSSARNGAYETALPTVLGKVSWKGTLDVAAEWKRAQALTSLPVKYTVPGPMTILGTVKNQFYDSDEAFARDLADVINIVVSKLIEAGCRHIQIDEPLFARRPEDACAWGVKFLDRCFEHAESESVDKTVHICCGYPEHLDQVGYAKADPDAYKKIAPAIDRCCANNVSIEDAHCHNDLSLLSSFRRTKVVLGCVQSASSRVESVEEIEGRLTEALMYIEADRLLVSPDCGLALLPLPLLRQKLLNMCVAAERCRSCKKACR